MDISVIIPVHNEKENLETLYDDLIKTLGALSVNFEILMINDGSTDGSEEEIDMLAERDPRVRVIHLVSNYGQSSAMMAGFDHASGDIIIAMDGDNQNDPADIPRLLKKINEGYDVVSGWRKDRKDARFSRIIPSKMANWIISMSTGVQLHDYGCSFKAYRKHAIKGVRIYGNMHRFIPILSYWRGAKVAEIIVGHRTRRFGSSHYGLSRVTKILLGLILLRFLDKYLQHPIHFFGGFGVINLLMAFFSFLLMIYYKFWGGKTFTETPLPTLSVLFVLMGAMAILMGILAEIVIRIYYESHQEKTYRIARTMNLK